MRLAAIPLHQREQLFTGHMTAEGNRLVAVELANVIKRTGLIGSK
jgi:hypothetical protein